MNYSNASDIASLGGDRLDYVEIIVLSAMILIGCPMNVISFCQTMGVKKSFFHLPAWINSSSEASKIISRKPGGVRRCKKKTIMRSAVLKLHLTAANLYIILVYGLSQVSWLITYQWLGGDFLCKLIKFFDTFCFYSTSNIVVLIAIERATVALMIDQPRIFSSGHKKRLQCLVWLPWIFAGVCSLPQCYVWREFAPYSDTPDWKQCVTIWMAWKANTGDDDVLELEKITFQESVYNGVHLVLVFWLPAVIVVACYGIILIRFQQHIRKTTKEAVRTRVAANANEFRKRAVSFHKNTTTGLSSSSSANDMQETSVVPQAMSEFNLTVRLNGAKSISESRSAGLLTEVPIVINSSKILISRKSFSNVGVKTLTRAKKRTLKTTAWILSAYTACWTPYNVLELYRYLDPTMENRYLELLSNLIILNAVVNPLIYRM